MLIYLVRHGHTALNGKGIIQGHLDPPLSPTGHIQAERLGAHLSSKPFREVWSSDLLRAVQTTEGVLGGRYAEMKMDERLRARYMGSIQGQLWTEDLVYPDDVESDTALAKRLTEWLKDLLVSHTPPSSSASSPIHPPQSGEIKPAIRIATESVDDQDCILVVTHEECLLSLIGVLAGDNNLTEGMPPSPLGSTYVHQDVEVRDHLPNTAVAVLRVWWEEAASGSPIPRGRLEGWGQTVHLE